MFVYGLSTYTISELIAPNVLVTLNKSIIGEWENTNISPSSVSPSSISHCAISLFCVMRLPKAKVINYNQKDFLVTTIQMDKISKSFGNHLPMP